MLANLEVSTKIVGPISHTHLAKAILRYIWVFDTID